MISPPGAYTEEGFLKTFHRYRKGVKNHFGDSSISSRAKLSFAFRVDKISKKLITTAPPLSENFFFIFLQFFRKIAISSGGSRIFPGGGGANSQNCYYFSHFCQKLHENERIWTPRGGGRASLAPPLDPPMIRPQVAIRMLENVDYCEIPNLKLKKSQ